MKGLLYSGGIESTYLLQTLEGKIQPMYLRFGFKWEEAELEVCRKNTKKVENSKDLVVIEVDYNEDESRLRPYTDNEGQKSIYIEGRKLSLITNAAVKFSSMGINEIYEGNLGGGENESFRDSKKEFYDSLEKSLSLGLEENIKIKSPLIGYTKKEIAKKLSKMELDISDTISCMGNKKLEKCGSCWKCKERSKIIKEYDL